MSAKFSSVSHGWFGDLRTEGLQQSERYGKRDRAEYKPQQFKNTDPAKDGEADKKLVQFGLLLNPSRP